MTRHPARYSKQLLDTLFRWTEGLDPILDPFAGVGSAVFSRGMVFNELEREWAAQCPRGTTTRGDALHLPFRTGSVGAVVTSPCYGNRMADHHEAKDDSRRNTYRHAIGRPLHEANAGQIQWGLDYQLFHLTAWIEARRVLRPGGTFILNIKDHIRKGERVPVTLDHYRSLRSLGFVPTGVRKIPCPGNRHGQNGNARIDHEWLLRFIKPTN